MPLLQQAISLTAFPALAVALLLLAYFLVRLKSTKVVLFWAIAGATASLLNRLIRLGALKVSVQLALGSTIPLDSVILSYSELLALDSLSVAVAGIFLYRVGRKKYFSIEAAPSSAFKNLALACVSFLLVQYFCKPLRLHDTRTFLLGFPNHYILQSIWEDALLAAVILLFSFFQFCREFRKFGHISDSVAEWAQYKWRKYGALAKLLGGLIVGSSSIVIGWQSVRISERLADIEDNQNRPVLMVQSTTAQSKHSQTPDIIRIVVKNFGKDIPGIQVNATAILGHSCQTCKAAYCDITLHEVKEVESKDVIAVFESEPILPLLSKYKLKLNYPYQWRTDVSKSEVDIANDVAITYVDYLGKGVRTLFYLHLGESTNSPGIFLNTPFRFPSGESCIHSVAESLAKSGQ